MIKLYDTRRRQKVDFEPVEPGKVSMYVCGPTVYNRIHIGNARTFISFDMIRRYLTWRGFDVTFVQNVTDVDDKIIKRAGEEARTAAEVAEEYTRLFIEDMRAASPRGNRPGARAVPVGTSSARPCPRSTWDCPSTSTAAGPIWCSRTTRTSAPNPSAPVTARLPTTGCTPACCRSPMPKPARPRRCRSR